MSWFVSVFTYLLKTSIFVCVLALLFPCVCVCFLVCISLHLFCSLLCSSVCCRVVAVFAMAPAPEDPWSFGQASQCSSVPTCVIQHQPNGNSLSWSHGSHHRAVTPGNVYGRRWDPKGPKVHLDLLSGFRWGSLHHGLLTPPPPAP